MTAAFSSRKPPQHLQSFWKQNCAGCVVAKGKTQGDTSPSNEDDDEETDWYNVAKRARQLRRGALGRVRKLCDEAEASVPASDWPLASYNELLVES